MTLATTTKPARTAHRSPAGPLMLEHRVIERMIAILKTTLEGIRTEGTVSADAIDVVTDFIRTYADRCHHGKEEDILFARLAEKGLPAQLAADMQALIDDHKYSRKLTSLLAEANSGYRSGNQGSLEQMAEAIGNLLTLYPAHIDKEDRHFFKPALELFSDDERAQMLADFADFDASLIHEKYRAVVERLESV